jgi:hypothetical protein
MPTTSKLDLPTGTAIWQRLARLTSGACWSLTLDSQSPTSAVEASVRCLTVAEQVSFYTRRECPFVTVAINLTFPLVLVASCEPLLGLSLVDNEINSSQLFCLSLNFQRHIKSCDQHRNGANNTLLPRLSQIRTTYQAGWYKRQYSTNESVI